MIHGIKFDGDVLNVARHRGTEYPAVTITLQVLHVRDFGYCVLSKLGNDQTVHCIRQMGVLLSFPFCQELADIVGDFRSDVDIH